MGAWGERRYKAAFISKLNDAESEASETIVWLEMARSCKYLEKPDFERLSGVYDHIIAQTALSFAPMPPHPRSFQRGGSSSVLSILNWLICSETSPSMNMIREELNSSMDMLVNRCIVRKVYM